MYHSTGGGTKSQLHGTGNLSLTVLNSTVHVSWLTLCREFLMVQIPCPLHKLLHIIPCSGSPTSFTRHAPVLVGGTDSMPYSIYYIYIQLLYIHMCSCRASTPEAYLDKAWERGYCTRSQCSRGTVSCCIPVSGFVASRYNCLRASILCTLFLGVTLGTLLLVCKSPFLINFCL